MNILLINPPNTPFTSEGLLIEPIDILQIANVLIAEDYKVTILDMDKLKQQTISNILNINSSIIVFDHFIPLSDNTALENIKNIIAQLKLKNIKTILIGKISTFANDEILLELNADVYITNEVETTILSILNNNKIQQEIPNIKYIENNKIIKTNTNTIVTNKLNLQTKQARTLLNTSTYLDIKSILTSKGCHNKCKFCHVPKYWGNWKSNTIESILDEICYIHSTTKTNKIILLDDNAIVNNNRMLKLSEELIKLNLPIAFGCLGSIDRYNKNMLATMYTAGFRWIHYGIETGDNNILKNIQKNITTKQIQKVLSETKKLGYRIRISIILDLPETTLDTLDRTLELLLNIEVDEIRIHYLNIRLGSEYETQYGASPTQYIHHNQSLINHTALTKEVLQEKCNNIINELIKHGYTYIEDPNKFIDVTALHKISPTYKIVSVCPIRYGLGWIK